MAVSFGEQIHALTGFDGDDDSASEIGENYDDVTAEWMNSAVREVVNILPPELKEKCVTETTLTNSSQTMDLDGVGNVLHVTRLSADSGGFRIPCRQVPSPYGEMSGDSASLYFASVTDPAYWISSSNDAVILTVNPTPTDNQTAIVYHVGYPSIAYNDTSIANFPDEAEYLVEEDVELYGAVLTTIKAQYQEGVLALTTGNVVPPQPQQQRAR